MNTPPIAPPTKPDLRSLLDGTQQRTMAQMNCHQVGQVVSFDATKQTASVQLSVLAVLADGSQVPYPVLTDCPVFVYSGGGAVITMPIAAGDPCLVLFNDRDLDNWFTTGNVVAPNSPRSHSLSDGMVLVGFRNLSNVVASYSTADAVLQFAGSRVAIKANGNVEVVSANGGSVILTAKVGVSNGSGSLLSALDALCTALTSWVNTGGTTPNPATVAAIAAVKTSIDALLA